MDLYGKVALVTGGAVRVGKAIALALAVAGADVAFSYHSSAEAAVATAAEIETLGRRVLAFRADQAQADQVAALVDATVSRLGRLDVLVNCASLWRRTPWAELDEAAWDQLLAINLKGPMLCAKAAAPHLAADGDGVIINVIDLSAWQPFPNLMPHSAAKAGLLNLTYALAMELKPAIRVNADCARPSAAAAGVHREADRGHREAHVARPLGQPGGCRGRGDLSGAGRLCDRGRDSRGWRRASGGRG